MNINPRIFEVAPALSRADVAILVAALGASDDAAVAYRYWRDRIEWQAIPVQWQRLMPLLHQNMSRMGIQDAFIDRIKGVRRFLWARNLRLVALAKTVHLELARAALPVLSLKGTSLVVSGYTDRSVRPMDDVDILIPEDHLARAIEILAGLGIQPRFTTTAGILDRVIPDRQLSGWPFSNAAGDEIDVHWNAMHLDRRRNTEREMWSVSRTLDFEGVNMRVLSPPDQLVTICAHGARDTDAGSIRWISDAFLVIDGSSTLDWQVVIERARTHELSGVMANALELLSLLFRLPIKPQTIAKLKKQATWCERLEARIRRRPFDLQRRGLAAQFLKTQEFRRGSPELWDTSFLNATRARAISTAGTKGLLSATARHLYFALGRPSPLRALLAPDRRLPLPPIDAISVRSLDIAATRLSEANFLHGWSVPEQSGRWTDGHAATIALGLNEPTNDLPAFGFDVSLATTPEDPTLDISVFVNDRKITTRRLEKAAQTRLVVAPPRMRRPADVILVTFEIDNPHHPLQTSGAPSDKRCLGLFLSRITTNAPDLSGSGTTTARSLAHGPAGQPVASRPVEMLQGLGPREIEMDEPNRQILERLKSLERRIADLEEGQERLQQAYGRARVNFRRLWIRPPMWTFEQHHPRPLDLKAFQEPIQLPAVLPRIAIVTPSFNQVRFVKATVDSVLGQNYPELSYHIQDGGSSDGTVDLLKSYSGRLSWESVPDEGQADAINRGFSKSSGDIMGYLNSDDMLLPGTLAYVVNFFNSRPDVDIVYGHRIFVDAEGHEIGRALLPAHSDHALRYAGYIPQETMFWRRRVWEAVGSMDANFQYALDWDFMLRAQKAGFKFARARRFLACFRVHDDQKTTKNYDVGRSEMGILRMNHLGHVPPQSEIVRALFPYLLRQFIFHLSYKLGLVKQ